MNDLALFLGQMVRQPGQVSAIAPSSARLARAMANRFGPQSGRVAELGPGTGRITRALLARGLPHQNLTLFELNAVFCRKLRVDFPNVRVEHRPAQEMLALGLEGLEAVVSGLPLLSMSPGLQHDILQASFDCLAPDGVFVQFTYGPRPPLDRHVQQRLGLEVRRTARILLNLPPASVYEYYRPQA